jgi:hypothetical protein
MATHLFSLPVSTLDQALKELTGVVPGDGSGTTARLRAGMV